MRWTRASELRAVCSSPAPRVCDVVHGRLRYELRLTWLGGTRVLERVASRRRNALDERPSLGVRDAPALLWRALTWRRAARAFALQNLTVSTDGAEDELLLFVPGAAGRRSGARSSRVWDFCRAVDDAVDECVDGNGAPSGREAVRFWRAELAAAYAGESPSTPQAQQLMPFIREFDLPRDAFEDVIDGVAMDVDTKAYDTFDHLFEYCRRVASAVGMICIRIFGCTDARAREYALNLGVALQLTNILRDIRADLERGRVYLPPPIWHPSGAPSTT